MVVTSHWPEVMKELPDYVVWLDEGEVVEEGDPETVVGKFLEHVPELKERKRVEFVNPIIKVRNLKNIIIQLKEVWSKLLMVYLSMFMREKYLE